MLEAETIEITDIRVKLMEGAEDRLRGFCSITFDNSFVIRDLKIIQGNSGPFVAMPSRKISDSCPRCRSKNHLKARFCNHCGSRLTPNRQYHDPETRSRLYADIAHPINASSREAIQNSVLKEFYSELERAKLPDYKSRYDDEYLIHSDQDSGTSEATVIRVDEAHGQSSPVPGAHSPPAKQESETELDR